MNSLKIAGIKISQNANGLYSLNDLHKASGGDPSKRPGNWVGQDRSKRLIAALDTGASILAPLEKINGDGGGTFGVRHILVAYATYLSVKMEIAVQDAFLEKIEAKALSPAEQMLATAILMVEQEKVNAQIPILTDKVAELADKVSHTDDLFHLGDRTSIKAYCNTRQVKLSTKQASMIGRACAKLCSKEGVGMTKLPCPYFGEVNGYPVWVVEEILAGWGYLD